MGIITPCVMHTKTWMCTLQGSALHMAKYGKCFSLAIFNPAKVIADLRDTNSFLKYCYIHEVHRLRVMISCTFVRD